MKEKKHSLLPLISIALFLSLFAVIGVVFAQSTAKLLFETNITEDGQVTKFPQIAAYKNTVHVVTNPHEERVKGNDPDSGIIGYASKKDTEKSFPKLQKVGDDRGQADYVRGSITINSKGDIYTIWPRIPIMDKLTTLQFRKKPAGKDFLPEKEIPLEDTKSEIPTARIATTKDNKLIAIWSQGKDGEIHYRISTDDGNIWSEMQTLPNIKTHSGNFTLSTSSKDLTAIAIHGQDGVYMANWKDNKFISEQVAPQEAETFFSEPSIAIDNKNNMYIAWRDSNIYKNAILFAKKNAAEGTWKRDKILTNGNEVKPNIAIAADSKGNMHIAAIVSDSAGQISINYITHFNNGKNSTPLVIKSKEFIANLHMTLTESSKIYSHIVLEYALNKTIYTRYYLIDTGVTGGGEIGCNGTEFSGIVQMWRKEFPLFLTPFIHNLPFEHFPYEVGGAKLTAQSQSGKTFTTESDEMGHFLFPFEETGVYGVNVEKDRFNPVHASFEIKEDNIYGDFLLCPNGETNCPADQSYRVASACNLALTPVSTPNYEAINAMEGLKLNTDETPWGKYLAFLLTWLYSFAAGVAMLSLALASTQLTTSQGNVDTIKAAKNRIRKTIIALIIIFSAWGIVATIGGLNLLTWVL
ncbi:MAG: hypothetical protein WCP97_08860 [bacterium]